MIDVNYLHVEYLHRLYVGRIPMGDVALLEQIAQDYPIEDIANAYRYLFQDKTPNRLQAATILKQHLDALRET